MRSVFYIFIFNTIHFYNVIVFGNNIDNSERMLGESCYLKNNQQGICSELTACDSVKELFNQKRYSEIVHCRFNGNIPTVCCPHKNVSKFSKALLCDGPKESVKFQSKIILGTEAEVGEFPFYAALGYKDYKEDSAPTIVFHCGGSLIADDIVLTAAHCVNKRDNKPVVVRLGRTSLDLNDSNDNSPVQDIEIDSIKIHSGYSSRTRQNDIALIKLRRPAQLSNNVQTICISSRMENLPSSYSIIGFGRASADNTKTSNWLLKGTLNEYPFEQCQKLFETFKKPIAETQFCGLNDSGVSACQGDSGGPLFYQDDQRFYVFGIISYGDGCGSTSPGISTRVDKFLDWIETEMMMLE